MRERQCVNHPMHSTQLIWATALPPILLRERFQLRNCIRFIAQALTIAGATLSYCLGAQASNLVDYGQSYSAGAAPNPYSLFSGAYNPAAGSLMIDSDERFRMSWFLAISNATEFGQVDNFVDDIDELVDILEDADNAGDVEVNDTLTRFNRVIRQAGEDGYLKSSTAVSLPAFPLYWNPSFIPGTITFEANFASQIQLSILPDELIYDEQKETFNTSTSAYIKSALQKKISVGYSQQSRTDLFGIKDSELYLGAKINIYDIELSKQVFLLELLGGKDIEDVIEDEYKNNRIQSTAIGLDFGAILKTPSYILGVSLESLNGPSFDYGAVGVNCDQMPASSDQQSNCVIAEHFANSKGFIDPYEQHKKDPKLTISGSYYILDNWLASTSLDVVSHDDPVAGENQWFNLATSYHPQKYWLPGARVGFKKNLTDEKLSYVTFGLTFAATFNLDVIAALDDVIVDDEKAPRGFGFALSFEEHF